MKRVSLLLSTMLIALSTLAKVGDTTIVQCFQFSDPSPKGWQARYEGEFQFPDDQRTWSKILMVKTLKCDSATAADKWLCGEWDYITQTHIHVAKGDTFETFELASFVTPYGIRLDLTNDGWEWVQDVSDYAPLLKGKQKILSGNNQELLDLRFIFIEGTPAREVLEVQNIWPTASYIYEHLATDSLLKARKLVLHPKATSFKLKARISGHGHEGPRNCCEWDSKTHSYYINEEGLFRWNVWKNCGDNPIYPQGGTWPFDRAGWCPGTWVDEYDFALDGLVWPGDTLNIDYGIEMYRENGEQKGMFRMAHQLFSYGPLAYDYDAEIVEVLTPNNKDRYGRLNPSCQTLSFVLKNNGVIKLQNCQVSYKSPSGVKGSYAWTGSLQFGETDTVYISVPAMIKLRDGESFELRISKPNNIDDQNPVNNVYHTRVPGLPVLPSDFKMEFQTNDQNRARETRWFILNSNGGIVEQSAMQMHDDSTYTESFSLPKGSYQLVITDDAQDGMIMHWWLRNSEPDKMGKNGKIRLLNEQGDILIKLPFDFGEYIYFGFKVE